MFKLRLLVLFALLWCVWCYDPCYYKNSTQYGQVLAERIVLTNTSYISYQGYSNPINLTDSTGCYRGVVTDLSAYSVSRATGNEKAYSFTMAVTLENICTGSNSPYPFVYFSGDGDGKIITSVAPDSPNKLILADVNNIKGHYINENRTVFVTINKAEFDAVGDPLFTAETDVYSRYKPPCTIIGRNDEGTSQAYSPSFRFTLTVDQGNSLQFTFPSGVPVKIGYGNFDYTLEKCPCVFIPEADGNARPRSQYYF